MKNYKDLKYYLLITLFLTLSSGLQILKPQKDVIIVSSEKTNYTLDSKVLSLLSLGHEKLISSYLWMNTLLFSDHEHVKKDASSWMYRRFNLISDFNPKFYENYYYGGIYLSIIKDDTQSADKLFKKGLKNFVDLPDLLWNRAFNLCFELGKCEESLPLYKKLIKEHSSKYPLSGRIAAKIENGIGLEEESFLTLLETYKYLPEGPVKDTTKRTLYEIKKKIDLNCLNSSHQKKRCSRVDFFGNDYIFEDGKYFAKFNFNEKLDIK